MITDPIGDLLARIRNAANAGHRSLVVPYSHFKEAVCRVMEKEGYLTDVKKDKGNILITLAFKRRHPVITSVKNVSRPGLRVYKKKDELKRVLGGQGVSIISTPKGVMSGKEAREKGLGGEVLAEVW